MPNICILKHTRWVSGLWLRCCCPRKFPSRLVPKHTLSRRSTENESAIPETLRSLTHLYMTLKFLIFVEFPTRVFLSSFISPKLPYFYSRLHSRNHEWFINIVTNLFLVFVLIVDPLVSIIFTHRLSGRKINYIVIIGCCHIRAWVQ